MDFSATMVILLVDIAVFTIYVADVLMRFGIPVNLSITYYRYERIHRRLGILFPSLLIFICCTTIPIWFITSWYASAWGRYFVEMPVIAEVCLLAVAFSARYKKRKNLIYFHYTCAIIASVCAVVWMCLVAWQFSLMWLRIGLLLGFVAIGVITNTLKKCSLFWLELTAFYAIFFTLFFIYFVPFQV